MSTEYSASEYHPKITRGTFLRLLAGAAGTTLFSPQDTFADDSSDPDRETAPVLSAPASNMLNFASQFPPGDLYTQTERLLKENETFTSGRLETAEKLSGSPEFADQLSQFMGAAQVDSNQFIPPLVEIRKADDRISRHTKSLELLAAKQAEVEPKELEKLTRNIGSDADYLSLFNRTNRESCTGRGNQIILDSAIVITPEGQLNFKRDAKKLAAWLDTYPYLQDTCIVHGLTSPSEYGARASGSSMNDSVEQIFALQDPETGLLYTAIIQNTDNTPTLGKLTSEITTFHALGHVLSVWAYEQNPAFAANLSPDQAAKMALYELRHLNNPLIATDKISDLFNPRPNLPENLEKFLSDEPYVDVETLLQISGVYPFNRISGPNINLTRAPDGSLQVNGFINMFESLALTMNDRAFRGLPKVDNPHRQFESFGHFITDYSPKLVQASESGHRWAKVVLAGVDKYPDAFEHYQSLKDTTADGKFRFTPKNDKSAQTWREYLRLIVINSLVQELVMTGELNDLKASELFTRPELRYLGLIGLAKRFEYRLEKSAELAAFTHFLGSRTDNNVSRDYLNYAALMLVSK